MKKILITVLLAAFVSLAKEDYLSDMEDTVGYIKDSKGNNYIVVETKNGAKLVKIKENPQNLLKGKFGITKEDLKSNGKEK